MQRKKKKKYWISLNALLMVVAEQYVYNGRLSEQGVVCFSVEAAAGEGGRAYGIGQAGRARQPRGCQGQRSGCLQPQSPNLWQRCEMEKRDFSAGCAVFPSMHFATVLWSDRSEG